jgi:hypothetical protein
MLKKSRKRGKWVELAYAEFRMATRRNPIALGAVLAALIFSSFVIFSPQFSVLAHPKGRPVALPAGAHRALPLAVNALGEPQSEAVQDQKEISQELDGWERPITALPKDRKPAPAPRRDISGIWDPGLNGIGMLGAKAMPDDGKPEHQLPYTPLGLQMLARAKPNSGTKAVLPGDTNDPVFKYGDPQGMPREDLYELRTIQIFRSPQNMAILYQFNKVWRVIWTDGRKLPENPEPRWYGYSVGKWADDYTFVVETIGVNVGAWLDRIGRPHGPDLRIEERFHRPDRDHLELSVTIDDPKMYTRAWVALDKLVFEQQPGSFDVREMIWSPSEYEKYNKLMGITGSEKDTNH